jgi:hypothetical protein
VGNPHKKRRFNGETSMVRWELPFNGDSMMFSWNIFQKWRSEKSWDFQERSSRNGLNP